MPIVRRILEALKARSWSALFFEVALIVIGILLALAIDGWNDERKDRVVEGEYLRLLVRDLDLTIDQLETTIEYADKTIEYGLGAYRELSEDRDRADREAVIRGINALTGRLTVRPYQATYSDLLSTGNIRLIKDHNLRDQISSYYETAQLSYQTFDRNRTFFNDELFAEFVIGQALIVPYFGDHPVEQINQVAGDLTELLGAEFDHRPGRLQVGDIDDETWESLRTRTWAMILTTDFLKRAAQQLQENAEATKASIEAELGRKSLELNGWCGKRSPGRINSDDRFRWCKPDSKPPYADPNRIRYLLWGP